MNVHFSASLRVLEEDIEIYRRILNVVRSMGWSIAHDWVETAYLYERNESVNKPEIDWSSFVPENEAALGVAEVQIVEASHFSGFGVGYETALAMQYKKPTLILIKREFIAKSYAAGLGREGVVIAAYTDEDLEKIVEDFLHENSISSKDLRFNFVLDRSMHEYLRRKSFSTGKTKAEIVRELVLRDMGSSEMIDRR